MAKRVTVYFDDETLLDKVNAYSKYREISFSRGVSELLATGIQVSEVGIEPSETVLDKFKEIQTSMEASEKQNEELPNLLGIFRKIIVDDEDRFVELEEKLVASELPPAVSNQLFSILHSLKRKNEANTMLRPVRSKRRRK
jgi:hypothetical protein